MSAPAPASAKPLFPLGRVVITPGALQAVPADYSRECLLRHAAGDFGSVGDEQAALSRYALTRGHSVQSAYPIDPAKPCNGGNTLWIITSADRRVTAILLPDER